MCCPLVPAERFNTIKKSRRVGVGPSSAGRVATSLELVTESQRCWSLTQSKRTYVTCPSALRVVVQGAVRPEPIPGVRESSPRGWYGTNSSSGRAVYLLLEIASQREKVWTVTGDQSSGIPRTSTLQAPEHRASPHSTTSEKILQVAAARSYNDIMSRHNVSQLYRSDFCMDVDSSPTSDSALMYQTYFIEAPIPNGI
ncbi:uncharacterized protein LACBIDRAFT_333475 [Laccaria bicolor S238N-H82]|uniref:Predicted protein n=1 Tax=Laccaria bicolor (strain S238N-H82 / ATCC MYA-4686) TaxID=486041 RepID=B0DW16_LACBS|nr:uncharacterized protein LACBIDRAFT_333475 [Laccaria bicolor S238N-H82]EDR01267.1 predicted protein [Laccaria bicolor S238N-H82]|eukprot:XP_001888143.1 predicted protein [Laccaria bicolor S238N-H82]